MKPPKKNPAAVALGRLGGKKRVPKGFSTLTPEQRSKIAKAAAFKRWSSRKSGKGKKDAA
jgi:hypothetical protein